MSQAYSPDTLEQEILNYWMQGNYFTPTKREEENLNPYSVLMPPPNVTNVLHLGHALNNTIQDVMVRYARMTGKAAMWKPGVDHAGIATENMVEKYLKEKGIEKQSLSREEFLKHVGEWKDQYGAKIVTQLQRVGSSADWKNLRYTMDDVSQKAVKKIFMKLFNDGLIYRGEYIVNWCPHCLTALSDEEVENENHKGQMYFIYYRLKNSDDVLTVATTRPETIFGDVALAVNPQDERYQHLIGKIALTPIMNQEIPIIGDESVEKDFGTGVLKITPSHDITDFEIGKRHHLPLKEVLHKNGTMNAQAMHLEGKDRFDARKQFVKELEEKELIDKIDLHEHSRGVCYRCSYVIEPRISKQWFVKMEPLAKPALQALKEGKLEFTPKKWDKVYEQWLTNIKDWCISRQISWGHEIPAFHCGDCGHIMVAEEKVNICSACQSEKITQDPDVLDTWFSSWIWPLTVFNWPEAENQLKTYYPTQFIATAPEIIFFWIARMVMAGIYVTQQVPFHKVFFNSTICDMKGRKMSKSLGNGIDPLEIIKQYGADAMRFTMLYVAPKGERIRIETKSFDLGYRLVNKLWNSSRFIFSYSQLEKISIDKVEKDTWDQGILYDLARTIEKTKQCYEKLDYFELSHTLYQFFWNQFCDWYLESSKIKLNGEDLQEKTAKYSVMIYVFESILKLFHPLTPFVTEYLFQKINTTRQPLMKSPYPTEEISGEGALNYQYVKNIQQLIMSIRNIRGELNFGTYDKLSIVVDAKESIMAEEFQKSSKEIMLQARLSSLELRALNHMEEKMILFVEDFGSYAVVLDNNFNIQNEVKRLKSNLEKVNFEIERAQGKLANKNFIGSAQTELVEKEQEKIELHTKKQKIIKEALKQIESDKDAK